MTPDELAKLRELCDAASPGPWQVGRPATCRHRLWLNSQNLANLWSPPGIDITDPCAHLSVEDAMFIAAARDAVPRLLDYVAELEAKIRIFKTTVRYE